MRLVHKFTIGVITSIFVIALVNILSFYIFYGFYLKVYLYEKAKAKESVTLELINDIVKKKALDDIDKAFSDTEFEFFELLEINKGKIPLEKEENIDIVVNYLVKTGFTPKYIEEIIPTDNFKKILESVKKDGTPENIFLNKFISSVFITNILTILIIIIFLWFFSRKTLSPINIATEKIKKMDTLFGNNKGNFEEIYYKNPKDEIGLLVDSINNLNKRLGLQNQIRTRLLADISHELKTPITSLQCYFEGISDGVIKLNEKNLSSISYEMNRLISLVNKIMDFENFDRKDIKLNLEKFDLVEILKNISETHKKRLSENNQRIKITGENFLEIDADKDLFVQLSHNLVGNFLKYSGKNTQLTINITKKYLDFYDNGIGIKSSEIPFLTEKFYQGKIEKSGDAEKRGIGVGLSIVSKIIESHNWRYEIKTDLGKGFSFKIFIK